MAPSGALDAAFIALLGIAYAAVGARVAGRRVARVKDRHALTMFAMWWWGIAGLFLLSGAAGALRSAGIVDAGPHLAIVLASMLSLCAGLIGILYYVTYLITGGVRAIVAYVLYYSLIFAALAYGVTRDAGEPEAWVASVSRLVILTGPILTGAIFAFLIPVIMACTYYASLFTKVDGPRQKLRIACTSLAFILWFGSAIGASIGGVTGELWWTAAGRTIGVAATGLLLLGYWSPSTITSRWAPDPRQA